MLEFVSENIKNIVPYTPGKPIEELERELGIKGILKLASNENPLGPSRKAIEAIEGYLGRIHRYPDGGGFYLKRGLSEKWGVSQDEIILGNGSNEIIELLVRTFMAPGDNIVISENTFSVYALIARAANCEVTSVPMDGYKYDLGEMGKAINDRTRLIFISNPNNPTGTIVTTEEVEEFMAHVPDHVIIVFDEAYGEYVTSPLYPQGFDYLRRGYNVAILRTFSKIYGLAGLRIGYGITKAEFVDMMNRVRQPFNTNALAQVAALAALEDTGHVEESREMNQKGKEWLYGEFEKMGIPYVPTEANFIYFQTPMDGKEVFEKMLKEGIIIRHMGGKYLRVTIGMPEENKRFINALRKVLHKEVL